MKIIINESEDLCVEELMILYLLHNRSDEEVDLMTDNIIENYFDEDRANKAGILELRNIQVQDIPDKELSDLTEKFRDIFRGKRVVRYLLLVQLK